MHFNHALIFASAPWATGDEAMALPYDARARKVTESLPPCPTGQRARLGQDLRLGDADRPRGRGEEEFDTTFNQSHQSRGRGLTLSPHLPARLLVPMPRPCMAAPPGGVHKRSAVLPSEPSSFAGGFSVPDREGQLLPAEHTFPSSQLARSS